MVDGVFSSDITDKYEHLIRKNSGTVNNKFFFSLNFAEELEEAEMKSSPVLVLGKKEGKKLAFNESWDNLEPNAVFLFSEEQKPALFTLSCDVKRDGRINVADITALVNIIHERDKAEFNYDYDAADVYVGENELYNINDITKLINIIHRHAAHPDIP